MKMNLIRILFFCLFVCVCAAESGWQVVKLCERNHYPRMVGGEEEGFEPGRNYLF